MPVKAESLLPVPVHTPSCLACKTQGQEVSWLIRDILIHSQPGKQRHISLKLPTPTQAFQLTQTHVILLTPPHNAPHLPALILPTPPHLLWQNLPKAQRAQHQRTGKIVSLLSVLFHELTNDICFVPQEKLKACSTGELAEAEWPLWKFSRGKQGTKHHC